MNKILKVHPKVYPKVYAFIAIILTLALINLIISIINYSIVSNKLDYLEENDPDLIITGLSFFQFLEKKNPKEYNISEPNLGSTGKIIFDCFSGECTFKQASTCYKTKCSGSKKRYKYGCKKFNKSNIKI